MAFTCCCTNQCPACGQCCQVVCGHRVGSGTYVSPNTTPYAPVPTVAPTFPTMPRPIPTVPPIDAGKTYRAPLTEEDVCRIIREELERSRSSPRQELAKETE